MQSDETQALVSAEAEPSDVDLPAEAQPLRPQEYQLLQEIVAQGSIRKAAQVLNISDRTARNWLNKPNVRAEWDKMRSYSPELEVTKRELELVAQDIPTILEEAKNATMYKDVSVQCPRCHHKFTEKIEVIAWQAKLKAIELLGRFTATLIDRQKVETKATTTKVEVKLSAAELVALERWQRGEGHLLPEPMKKRLRELANQGAFELPSGTVDGEFRELG